MAAGIVRMPDGTLVSRGKGTPQGGVISPLLANLFLHYAFDRWMQDRYPEFPFERYADDVICHCRSEAQARWLLEALGVRFSVCQLELHARKTQIVYCKDANRRGSYPHQRFDFLGHTFRPRRAMNGMGQLFVSFAPAMSDRAAKRMRRCIRRWRLHRRNDLAFEAIAEWTRPVLLGWIRYYGRFQPSALRRALRTLDHVIVRWAWRKYKRLMADDAGLGLVASPQARRPDLFAHWHPEAAVGR